MNKIVKNTLAKICEKTTLDEIITALKRECDNEHFSYTEKDWREMMDDLLWELSEHKNRLPIMPTNTF